MSDKITFVYLVQILTYGRWHPMKVGISGNVRRRLQNLSAMGIDVPKLVGTFALSSKKEAGELEREILKRYPRCRKYRTREAIWAQEDEILAFVEDHFPHLKFVWATA